MRDFFCRPLAAADVQFLRFCSAKLRRRPGHRLTSAQIMDSYCAWVANEPVDLGIGFRRLRSLMDEMGYEYRRSDGSWYVDVGFANRVDAAVHGTEHHAPAWNGAAPYTLARLDAIAADLADLRRRIEGGASAPAAFARGGGDCLWNCP